jgi:hypothetical protein
MITSWADEEDKANAKYDAIRGKSKQNTGGNNNNNNNNNNNGNQGGRNSNYSGPNRKRKPDNTVAAIQRPAKDNSKKASGGFKDLLKEKCPWHLDGNHTTEQCYQLRRALKDTPEPRHPHDKKGKKKDRRRQRRLPGTRQDGERSLRRTTQPTGSESYSSRSHEH